jgi:lysophospholipase L1-like esterase
MKLLTTTALCLLTACGGGGGGESLAQPAAASCISGRAVVVELFGDSTNITKDEVGNINGPGTNLQAYMDATFGPGQVVVRSKAIGGTTSQNLIDGQDRLNTPWPTSKSGDVVLVNHGINDFFASTPLDAYRANLAAFVKAGAILQTPLPTYTHTEYPRVMREVAQATGADLIDLNAWMSQQDWRAWTPDQLHPTQDGWKAIVSGFFGPEVAKRVRAVKC